MDVKVHIERLILDGLPVTRRDAASIKAAVESELSRLLAAEGVNPLLTTGGSIPSLRAPTIRMSSGSTPTAIGERIASAVYKGIGR